MCKVTFGTISLGELIRTNAVDTAEVLNVKLIDVLLYIFLCLFTKKAGQFRDISFLLLIIFNSALFISEMLVFLDCFRTTTMTFLSRANYFMAISKVHQNQELEGTAMEVAKFEENLSIVAMLCQPIILSLLLVTLRLEYILAARFNIWTSSEHHMRPQYMESSFMNLTGRTKLETIDV